MAAGNLSPRQKMINMMYLVLTALLALNVSKEVLNSFFEVNTGIERTTTNFNAKNNDTYSAFDNAAENNPAKYKDVRDKAYSVKENVDAIILYIQEMKYDLVSAVDKEKVYLGSPASVLDEDGKLIEEHALVGKKFNELTVEQKRMSIAALSNKDNRDEAGELFFPKHISKEKRRATLLRNQIIEYRDVLIDLAKEDQSLVENINEVCDVSNHGKGKKIQSWEEYNFVDMPSVGALTILSKIQSNLRNIEADVINYLKRSIDAKSLKFTSAEGIQIPRKSFILRGDSFRAEIFITAKNESQNPDVYVGEYDSLGGGQYQMVGDYETVKVVNGKGLFATRTTSEGVKKWGGLIAMKTESGTKFYPFGGEYLVAAKTAVVSPVNMNVFYLEVDNPIKISVPGFAAADISASMTNGNVRATKKSAGEWIARPNKKGKAVVTLFATTEGKRTRMGTVEFRVKEVPPPKPYIGGKSEGIIAKQRMLAAGGIQSKLEDFDFKGVRYKVVSYSFTAVYKGDQVTETVNGQKFNEKINAIINNTKSGNSITVSNIKAKRTDAKGTATRSLPPLVLKIK
ncbi:MAG: hypothetical protein H8E84_03290 [Flavobacteriales bacterium]|nr:hypothetical protein [Flavobacteriales bacterium]